MQGLDGLWTRRFPRPKRHARQVGGGDVTRKKKLLEKQKEGKKRLRRVGNVELSQEVRQRQRGPHPLVQGQKWAAHVHDAKPLDVEKHRCILITGVCVHVGQRQRYPSMSRLSMAGLSWATASWPFLGDGELAFPRRRRAGLS